MSAFLTNSILLGAGLAMDAFSVSIVNGLNEFKMSKAKTCGIAGTFAFFQFVMPMIGWLCVHTVAESFISFQKFVPWISLILLVYIGGKMLLEGISSLKKNTKEHNEYPEQPCELRVLGFKELLLQGTATSIDALSVGFTIEDYNAGMAFLSTVIIGVITFIICMLGLIFGKKFGEKLSCRATIAGGVILMAIGIKIFAEGFAT